MCKLIIFVCMSAELGNELEKNSKCNMYFMQHLMIIVAFRGQYLNLFGEISQIKATHLKTSPRQKAFPHVSDMRIVL